MASQQNRNGVDIDIRDMKNESYYLIPEQVRSILSLETENMKTLRRKAESFCFASDFAGEESF